ncbi:PREDICTED: uncharacterized protein LOC108780007, partial [Cyphomyrmex costatus]|uniref:uncharacterized protein LOC108780007 n=1 Tax=Cyphomyrmex costatus TaxID=456900 RepID=UPI0008523773
DEDCKAILLATARLTVADRHGNPHPVRALIDQGSEVSLISEALVQHLRLPRSRAEVTIFGIGGSKSGFTRGKVTLNLISKVNGQQVKAVAFILPRLSLYQGAAIRHARSWPHIKDLQLADPEFMATDPVELLLGAEVCSIILQDGLRKGDPQTPVAQRTLFGWILSGGCGENQIAALRSSFQCTADHDLTALVQQFWDQEKEPTAFLAPSPNEQLCEKIFSQTHTRTETGRYMVRLPFASIPTPLNDTCHSAQRMLTAMENKFKRNTRFGELYRDFLKEYEQLGHMELTSKSSDSQEQGKCYLPHHGVLRESSASTKLRVVFNGSQPAKTGKSLNSQLLTGANLLPPLADLLTRWRWHRYVFVADIEKMYRQILVFPEDREYQRILWRQTENDSINEYKLNTVTYGLSCAPFLAIRTLRQLADDEGLKFPQGSAALRRDSYVDDIVTGTHTKSQSIALQTELRQLCMAGGFTLKKWAANCLETLVGIPADHCL